MEERRFGIIGINDSQIAGKPLTQEDADKIRALVDSVSRGPSSFDPLGDIILEGIRDFSRGMITAQDAARIIQNRASNFVAEQSR